MKSIFKSKKGAQVNTKVASLFSSKKAAMEMSMGTIVTIVLLMSVLILGLVLTKNIFKSSQGAISGVDNAMQNEMNQMFSDDATKTVILVPATKKITLKKGDDNLGFGFSIRNTDQGDQHQGVGSDTFSYTINATSTSCGITTDQANLFIPIRRTGSNIKIPRGSIMEEPIFIRFIIPNNAPPCLIAYNINVWKNGVGYGDTKIMDVEIKSK